MKLSIAVAGCLAGLIVASALASTVAPASTDRVATTRQPSPVVQQGAPALERGPAAHVAQ